MAILVAGVGKGREGIVPLRLGKAGIIVREHLPLSNGKRQNRSVVRVSIGRRTVVEGANGITI